MISPFLPLGHPLIKQSDPPKPLPPVEPPLHLPTRLQLAIRVLDKYGEANVKGLSLMEIVVAIEEVEGWFARDLYKFVHLSPSLVMLTRTKSKKKKG